MLALIPSPITLTLNRQKPLHKMENYLAQLGKMEQALLALETGRLELLRLTELANPTDSASRNALRDVTTNLNQFSATLKRVNNTLLRLDNPLVISELPQLRKTLFALTDDPEEPVTPTSPTPTRERLENPEDIETG